MPSCRHVMNIACQAFILKPRSHSKLCLSGLPSRVCSVFPESRLSIRVFHISMYDSLLGAWVSQGDHDLSALRRRTARVHLASLPTEQLTEGAKHEDYQDVQMMLPPTCQARCIWTSQTHWHPDLLQCVICKIAARSCHSQCSKPLAPS